MKKNFLLILCLLFVGSAYSKKYEKNGISVKYKKMDKWLSQKFGMPYELIVQNNSSESVLIKPSIITTTLATRTEVDDDLLAFYEMLIPVVMYGLFVKHYDYEEARNNPIRSLGDLGHRVANAKVDALIFLLEGAGLLSLFYRGGMLWKRYLSGPFTLKPGSAAKKIFWLKDPEAQFEINFDAVKVLK